MDDKWRRLNPFRPVTRVFNRAPFTINFMVSHVLMPPDGSDIHPLHIALHRRIPPNGEIQLDPLIFEQGADSPKFVYATRASGVGEMVPRPLRVSHYMLSLRAIVSIRLDVAEGRLFAEGEGGNVFQRAKPLVKARIVFRKVKKFFKSAVPRHLDEQEESDEQESSTASSDIGLISEGE